VYWPTIVKDKFNRSNEGELTKAFVDLKLKQLDEFKQECELKLLECSRQIYGFKTTMKPQMECYLSEHHRSIELDIEFKLTTIDDDYEDERLKNAINDNQTAYLFELKHDLEMSKQEYQLLEEYRKRKQFPPLLASIDINLPNVEDSIQEHRQLIEQHRSIIENFKTEMLSLLANIARTSTAEKQTLYDNEIKRYWEYQQRLSSTITKDSKEQMLKLIDQRLEHVKRSVDSIYRHKYSQLFSH
jgi:hypothetical protein